METEMDDAGAFLGAVALHRTISIHFVVYRRQKSVKAQGKNPSKKHYIPL